jgi:hypothetical protein
MRLRNSHPHYCFASIALPGAIALTACAAYQEPISGPTAYLTLVGQDAHFAVGYGTYCTSKDLLPDADKKPVKVKAGERIWIQVNSGGSWGRCRGEVSFVPESGAHYVGRYQSCTFSFARATPNGLITGVPGAVSERERSCLTEK